MAFKPINPRNAILECVIIVHLDRPASPIELEAFKKLHPKLKADLPKLEAPEMPPVMAPFQQMMPGFAQIQFGPPLSMCRFKPDGSLETRLMLHNTIFAVNFLTYTRWRDIWSKARAWLTMSLEAMATATGNAGATPLHVRALAHQMIDVFKWNGLEGSVSVAGLLRAGMDRLPPTVLSSVGKGWYAAHSTTTARCDSGPFTRAGLVDFVTFDLSPQEPLGWRLRMEHTLEVRPESPKATTGDDFGLEMDRIFDEMHSMNQSLIRGLLRPEALSAIGMSN